MRRMRRQPVAPGAWLAYPGLSGFVLFNAGAGDPSEMFRRTTGTRAGTTLPAWGARGGDTGGAALQFAGGASLASYLNYGSLAGWQDLALAEGTLIARVFYTGDGSHYSGIAERNDNNAVNAGWQWGIDTTDTLFVMQEATTLNRCTPSSAAVTKNKWVTLATTWTAGTSVTGLAHYQDGVDLGRDGARDADGVGTVGSDAAEILRIGNARITKAGLTGTPGAFCGAIAFVAAFRRRLSQAELWRWSEPHVWQMFAPFRSRTAFLFSPAIEAARPFITVDDLEVTAKMETFSIVKSAGRPSRCNFDTYSAGGAYRPPVDGELICTENSTERIFGGLIDETNEGGVQGQGTSLIRTSVSAGSYLDYATWRTNITETRPEETLAARLEFFRSTYLDVFDVTLDPSQPAGPTLTGRTYSQMILLDILTDMGQEAGGYQADIDDRKVLSCVLAASVSAPFDITTANQLAELDVRVRRTGTESANKVFVNFGADGVRSVTRYFTGDGVTTTFNLGLPIHGPIPYDVNGAVGLAVVAVNAGNESIGGASAGLIWTYNPLTPSMTRTLGAPALGDAIAITYDVAFPVAASAVDAAWAVRPKELSFNRPNIDDPDVAQAVADQLLAVALVSGVEVHYQTAQTGIEPGMTQTINLSSRGIASATYTVTQVEIRNTKGNLLHRFVTAAAGSVARPDLLPSAAYDRWAGSDLAA